MSVTIVGTGALGGFLGARLLESGHQVHFVARGRNLETLKQKGLTLIEKSGATRHYSAPKLCETLAEAPPAEFVILCVKTDQVDSVLPSLLRALDAGGAVVTTQNGIETASKVAEVVGRDSVIGGAFYLSTVLESPGTIRHNGTKKVVFGELNDELSDRVVRLATGILQDERAAENSVTSDITTALWSKMVAMALNNALGSASRMPLGVFARVPAMADLLHKAALEAVAVARAYGARLAPGYEEKFVPEAYKWLDDVMLSMQRDFLDGKPSEFHDQVEAISRLGKARSVPTPIFDVLSTILLPQELLARGEISFDGPTD